jgi:ElaB/YqjD/DUF883 family membrane-anchored ribosome-binding protein
MRPMKDPTPGQARDKIVSDFRSLATHAQDLLQATASYSGDNVAAAREKLLESLADAREQMKEAQDYAIDQTRRAMKLSDEFVHERPWQSIAGAFLVGMLLGAISAGGRR